MKDRAERDVRGSVLLTPAGASLRSSFTARSGASRAARHASLEKNVLLSGDKSTFFRGAGGGGRTRTVVMPRDFKSLVSAIPPHRRVGIF